MLDAEKVADVFKAIGQATRLAILEALRHGEYCVSDLGRATGQAQSNLSKHLAFLRRAGVLAARRRGLRVFYRVAAPEVFEVLEAAQALLAGGLGAGGVRFPRESREAASR
jgi:ArsR family transcriptional regulator